MKRAYITAARLESIEAQLTPRDTAILQDVARLRLVSGLQLARLHFDTDSSARRLSRLHLARLVHVRVLMRLDRRVGGVRAGSDGYLYALDVVGRRLVAPDRTRWWPTPTPGDPFTRHTLTVAEVYVRLVEAARRSEFALVAFDGEPACWRRFHGPGGARQVLKPDAFVITAAGGFEDHCFVEVDMATEATTRITAKARAYISYLRSGREQAASGVFPQVVWLVPNERRRALVASALARIDAEYWQLFAVRLLTDAVDGLVPDLVGGDAS